MTIPASRSIALGGNQDVSWGVAGRPAPGERESADLCVVQPNPSGVLVAVIDGVGHGAEAVTASQKAAQLIEESAHEPVESIVVRCHDGLRQTRGIVMTLVGLDARARTLRWVGVGNVEATLFRAPGPHAGTVRVLTRPGVVGYQLPPLNPQVVPLRDRDTLVLSTDGIHADFTALPNAHQHPQELAERLLKRHHTGKDDALVTVVRYSEGGHA
jgi:serine/threonine protein phosphatase PrpC